MPIVVVFPGSVDADHEHDARTGVEGEDRRAPEQRFGFLCESILELTQLPARLQPAHELGGGGDAHVATDQRLLQTLPGLVVARVERRGRELRGQRAAALGERLAHACKDARPLRLVRRGRLVAEQLGPGTAHRSSLRRRRGGSLLALRKAA